MKRALFPLAWTEIPPAPSKLQAHAEPDAACFEQKRKIWAKRPTRQLTDISYKSHRRIARPYRKYCPSGRYSSLYSRELLRQCPRPARLCESLRVPPPITLITEAPHLATTVARKRLRFHRAIPVAQVSTVPVTVKR